MRATLKTMAWSNWRRSRPVSFLIFSRRLGIWGVINLLEGYGQDNPASKSQGMKQLMAGGGVALIGITLVPLLSGLFG